VALKKTLVVSDIHVPFNDVTATKTFLAFLKDFQPDELILNGDILDLKACSGHGDVEADDLLWQEILAGNIFLDEVRKAVGPKCKIHYNEGNHESRLTRFVKRQAPSLHGLTSIPELLKLRERKITWLPYSGDNMYFITKKLGVTHGFAHGTNYTRATLQKLNVSCIVGHAHRPEYSTAPVVDHRGQHIRGCWGSGCLVPVQHVGYLTAPSGWSQGWTVVYSDERTGDFSVYPINLANGHVFWNGKVYGVPSSSKKK
jgi:predicted phosphodiesterase